MKKFWQRKGDHYYAYANREGDFNSEPISALCPNCNTPLQLHLAYYYRGVRVLASTYNCPNCKTKLKLYEDMGTGAIAGPGETPANRTGPSVQGYDPILSPILRRKKPVPVGIKEEDVPNKTLYVHRKVKNIHDLREWAQDNRIPLQDDPHVTVAFSKEPVDWEPLGFDLSSMIDGPSDRDMAKFKDAIVLKLDDNPILSGRWKYFLQNGATWDFPSYQPHITIFSDPQFTDLNSITPYNGLILLGPEIAGEINEEYL